MYTDELSFPFFYLLKDAPEREREFPEMDKSVLIGLKILLRFFFWLAGKSGILFESIFQLKHYRDSITQMLSI